MPWADFFVSPIPFALVTLAVKLEIDVQACDAKFNSKRECYLFLASDCGVFLPPYDNVTIYFLKELMGGKKKMLTTAKIRTIHVPQ